MSFLRLGLFSAFASIFLPSLLFFCLRFYFFAFALFFAITDLCFWFPLFATLRARFLIKLLGRGFCRIRRTPNMALLLRRALLRSSSIPNCCSLSPIPSDSSHPINLSKTTLFSAASRLENPSICSNRFLFGSHYRQHATKISKDEIDLPEFRKPSPDEMIETCSQNLTKVLGSVEDAEAIEEMSDKLKDSSFEMIEQLKGSCTREKRSVEDIEVIKEMPDRLRKSGVELTEQLIGLRKLVPPNLSIYSKNNKFEGNIEKAMGESGSSDRCLGSMEMIIQFIEYVELMETTDMQKKSSNFKYSPESIAFFTLMVEKLKGLYGSGWRSAIPDRNSIVVKPRRLARPLVLRLVRRPEAGPRPPSRIPSAQERHLYEIDVNYQES